jgi:hypothetical protein
MLFVMTASKSIFATQPLHACRRGNLAVYVLEEDERFAVNSEKSEN